MNIDIQDLIEATDELMEDGEEVLNDPTVPESVKKEVVAEINNHKRCLTALGISGYAYR